MTASAGADAERARLKGEWPAEFSDGERCAFLNRFDGAREPGGYPKSFHGWPLGRRNAWYCGFGFGLLERQRALAMEAVDG
jgi:hypothetical protein